MGSQLFANSAKSTLSGTLSIGGTTLVLSAGEGSLFPAPTGTDFFLLTLFEHDVSGNEENYEIVKVTARTADTLTISRDFEGLVGVGGGRAYPTVGGRTVYCQLRWTAAGATLMVQPGTLGTTIDGLTGKTTPVDADEISLSDSAASFAGKKLTWANLKATLKTYFDSLAHTLTNKTINLTSNTLSGTTAQFNTALSDNDFATLAGSETLTNKTALAATNNIEARSGPGTSSLGFRNKIINGNFLLWQRGTSQVLSTSNAYGCADRWLFRELTTAACTASQSATGVLTPLTESVRYALKLQRTAAATTTGAIEARTALETSDSMPLRGKTVVLSFYALKGANYSPTSSALSVILYTGTGTDEAVANMASWTGVAAPIVQTATLTASWQRFQYTVALGATISQIGVLLQATPVGTAGADDSFYIANVQLEEGSVATPFENRPYATELALCQRYYYRNAVASGAYITQTGFATSTTNAVGYNKFPVTMRIAPTALEQSGTATDYTTVRYGSATTTACSAVPTFSSATPEQAITNFTVAAGLTNGAAGSVITAVGTAYLGWSAEL